jgi:hypothetical protein
VAACEIDSESSDWQNAEILEECLILSTTHSNALETFRSILALGMDPNVTSASGLTLFQRAIRLNRVWEVAEMLKAGVSSTHMSVFGSESMSNIDAAFCAGNEAGELALAWFGKGVPAQPPN